jgi:hypothetical protein
MKESVVAAVQSARLIPRWLLFEKDGLLYRHEKIEVRVIVGGFDFVMPRTCGDEDVREGRSFPLAAASVREVAGLLPDFIVHRVFGQDLFVFAQHTGFFVRADTAPQFETDWGAPSGFAGQEQLLDPTAFIRVALAT